MESVQKEGFAETERFERQMRAKSIIQEEIEENGGFAVEEIGEKIFDDQPELKAAFQDKMEKYNMVREKIEPQSENTTRKYQNQHLFTDTGIEIKIPMEQYKNPGCVEFITNPDGTVSVLIKNIENLSMGTILDYLKEYGDYSLEEKPFSEVDSLVISQLSYLKFDGIVPGPEEERAPMSLEEIAAHGNYDHLYADERYRKNNTALFLGALKGRRFGKMRLWNYVNQIKPEQESQFSAVVCGLTEKLVYVVFRGTDENIVGWKEDLNLAFSEPVPGQKRSVQYLAQAAQTFSGSFMVGGHSKGGNFAVYAAMHCDPQD